MPQQQIIAEEHLPPLRRRLLAWYRRNKRDLDWRRTRDPYRIWLSEIMLQQTRVAAVIPYYQCFVQNFPTVQALARAPQDAVLQNWAGLGYYSRARNLHQAAKEIVAKHGGKFPRTLNDALALPGVGSYTAAAVLSIAYNEPLAVLDGNVARVLARWGAMRGDLRQPKRWAQLSAASQQILAAKAPSDWNQAMMELGAMVCTPTSPNCDECPVAKWCQANAQGLADELPTPRIKKTTVRMTLAAAVLLDPQGRTLLLRHKNTNGTFFSHLWQFPAVEVGKVHSAATELATHVKRTLKIRAAKLEPLATAKHAVTFHNIHLAPYLLRVKRLPKIKGAATPQLSELGAADTAHLPISNATRKIARAAQAAQQSR